MRDQRDPQLLGEFLLHRRQGNFVPGLSNTYDANREHMERIPDFDASHQGPIEKYGRPQDIPTTPW